MFVFCVYSLFFIMVPSANRYFLCFTAFSSFWSTLTHSYLTPIGQTYPPIPVWTPPEKTSWLPPTSPGWVSHPWMFCLPLIILQYNIYLLIHLSCYSLSSLRRDCLDLCYLSFFISITTSALKRKIKIRALKMF